MSVIVISVDNSGVVRGGQGVEFASKFTTNKSITKRPQQVHALFPFPLSTLSTLSVIAQLYNLGRSFAYTSISKFLGV